MSAKESLAGRTGRGRARGQRKWVAHDLPGLFVYRPLAFGAAHFPHWLLRAISITGNTIAHTVLRRTVAGIAENYRIALGVDEPASRRLARRLFHVYGLTTIDLFRIRFGGEALAPRITTADVEARVLRPLVAGGRGFLIVSGHVGNWEMGAVSLLRHGIGVAIVGQKELDPRVHALRVEMREGLGLESITIGETVTTALKVRAAIDRGLAVAMVADRAYEDDRILVEFFGRPTSFLRSPALLARFCDCPILPGYFLRSADGTYRSFFGEPVLPDQRAPAEADARRMMTEVARVVERAVREEPEQWFNFYGYWPRARGHSA